MIMESIGESGFSPFDPTVNSPIEYTELLKRDLGQRMVFDLVVLGCGEDGHTASLFTGSELLKVNSEGFHRNQLRNGETRYSLTLDTLTIAKKRLILVGNVPEKHAYFEPTAMKKKQAPVHRILEGDNTHICIHEDL